MLSPPLSAHAKTEIYMILILSGEFFFSFLFKFTFAMSSVRVSGDPSNMIVAALCAFFSRFLVGAPFLTAPGQNRKDFTT